MTIPLWARTGGYQINTCPDRVIWHDGRPMVDMAGAMGAKGPRPVFQTMVDEDLYGHDRGFVVHPAEDGPPPAMQHGDLYG